MSEHIWFKLNISLQNPNLRLEGGGSEGGRLGGAGGIYSKEMRGNIFNCAVRKTI